jgi:hypothetical protein
LHVFNLRRLGKIMLPPLCSISQHSACPDSL